MIKPFKLFLILIISTLAACDSGSQHALKREALKEEMRNRNPKKLSQGQILQEAFRQGEQIALAAQDSLLVTLHAALQQQGTLEAVQYCNIVALPLMDSLAQKQQGQVHIKRTSLRSRNPANAPTDIEEQLLEAYAYNAAEGLSLEDNVQALDEQYLLYTKPIVLGSELCLNCHGQPQKDIAGPTIQLLDSLYPHDQARGYQTGELRGMWSIRLRKKDLVNAL